MSGMEHPGMVPILPDESVGMDSSVSTAADRPESGEAGHLLVGYNVILFMVMVCAALFCGHMLRKHHIHYLPDR